MKRWVENRVGVVWGTYRSHAERGTVQDVWLAIAPARPGRMFSVVVGSHGFYVGRWGR